MRKRSRRGYGEVTVSDQNNNRGPDDIEADIEKTRTQLGDDVEAITYQLSPERYREQLRQRTEGVQSAVSQGLTDAFDNAGERSRRASQGFLERLENDPLPAVLVALGVSVLAIGGMFSGPSAPDNDRSSDEIDLEYPSDRFPEDRPNNMTRSSLYNSGLRNSPNGPDYGRTIGDAPNAGALSGDQNLPTEGVDDYDYTGDGPSYDDEARREAKREAYRAKRGLVRLVGDHPLVAGSIITLAGMALGLSAPSTRQEDELLGRESDKFKAKAERAARQTKNVAAKSYKSAKETAKDEADKQDLSEGRESTRNAGPKAQNVAEKAAKDAKDTAEDEVEKKDSGR